MSGATEIGLAAYERRVDRRTIVRTALAALGAGLGGRLLSTASPALASAYPLVDVMSYGATGNGTSDDAPAIQAALNAGVGRTVYFPPPPDAYAIGSTLRVPSNCTLTGPEGGTSRIRCLPTIDNDGGVAFQNADHLAGNQNVTFQYLEVDGNRAARGELATAALILFTSNGTALFGSGIMQHQFGGTTEFSEHIRILHCYLHDSPTIAIGLQFTRETLVMGNEIANNARDSCSHFYDASYARIVHNYIHDGGDDLTAFNAEDIASNGHPIHHVLVANNVYDTQVEGVGGAGISLRGVTHGIARNNVVFAPYAAGATISNFNDTAARDILFCDNAIIDAGLNNTRGGGHGIDCQALGPSVASVSGFGSVSDATIDGNVVVNPKAHGIVAGSGTSFQSLRNVRISNNTVLGGSDVNTRGIWVSGFNVADVVLDGNVVDRGPAYGVFVGEGANTVERPVVCRNVVRNSATAAMEITKANDAMVYCNRAVDTRMPALQQHGILFDQMSGQLLEYGNDSFGTQTSVNYNLSAAQRSRLGVGTVSVLSGTGSPEGQIAALPGSLFVRVDGGASTTLYVKESGSGTTGWSAK